MEAASPATADLLHLGALLASEPIPEEIFLESAPELGDRLGPACSSRYAFTAMISAAHRLSLLQRDPEPRTLMIHRLVQSVLRDGMDDKMQRLWAGRAVRAVNRAFRDIKFPNWAVCELLVPHALVCAAEVKNLGLNTPESVKLLNTAGRYLVINPAGRYPVERGRLDEARALLDRALAIAEGFGLEHPLTALILNSSGYVDAISGNQARARDRWQRALDIYGRVENPDPMEEVLILDRLTYIYSQLWDKGQAEVYSRRALAIRESTFGARHPYTATGMEYLAGLLDSMGRHEEADVFMRRATEIRSAVLEPGDSDLSTILINQAQHHTSLSQFPLLVRNRIVDVLQRRH